MQLSLSVSSFNFHDTSIVSLQASSTYPYELSIGLRTEDEINYQLGFTDAYWKFSSFHTQNVLFDLQVITKANLSDFVIEEYTIESSLVDLITNQNYFLIILEPSVGMGGFVVAKEVQLLLNSPT
jgi:hypothetical protein